MRPAAWRLLLVAMLFAAWMAYLGYLAYSRPQAGGRPLVLSRPQILVSNLDLIARVDDPSKPVKIEQILYPPDEKSVHAGDEILVENLTSCRPPPRAGEPGPPPPDWTELGDYLIPLRRYSEGGKARYEVQATPPSPGFPTTTAQTAGPPRIYPATPQALAQYREIRKP